MTHVEISSAHFAPAPAGHRPHGLLGDIFFTVPPGLRLDGLPLRRSASGILQLAHPVVRDSSCRDLPLVGSVDDQNRRELQDQVLRALGFPQDREELEREQDFDYFRRQFPPVVAMPRPEDKSEATDEAQDRNPGDDPALTEKAL